MHISDQVLLERVPPFTDAEIEAGFRAIVRLFAHWQLTDTEAAGILDTDVETYRGWRSQQRCPSDQALGARLSLLLGIHKCLRILFHEPARGYAWIRRPNDAFDGLPALDLLTTGQLSQIHRVRMMLEAEAEA